MGGQVGGQFGTQPIMSSLGCMGIAPVPASVAGNPGWGQPISSTGGLAPLGGYNGHTPFRAMSQGAKPAKQGMSGKRSANDHGGHGNGMTRKFAIQCQIWNIILVYVKLEVLQTISPRGVEPSDIGIQDHGGYGLVHFYRL